MSNQSLPIEQAQFYYSLLQDLTTGGSSFVLKEMAAKFECSERMLYDAALACIELQFIQNDGGSPRKLTWIKSSPLTLEDVEALEIERLKIIKERDAGKAKNRKKRPLIEVFSDYSTEEIRAAYKAWAVLK